MFLFQSCILFFYRHHIDWVYFELILNTIIDWLQSEIEILYDIFPDNISCIIDEILQSIYDKVVCFGHIDIMKKLLSNPFRLWLA
jgi:hypothetical protein